MNLTCMGEQRIALIVLLTLCSIMGTLPNIKLVRGSVTFWDAPPDAIIEPTTVIIISPEENRTYPTNNVALTVNVGIQPVYDDLGVNSHYIRSVYYRADWLEKGEQIFYHLAAYEGKTYLMATKISVTLNLAGIPDGNHNITVYASDSYSIDTPSTVNFTINTHLQENSIPEFPDTTPPFPTLIAATIVIAAIAVFGVAILVYFKRIEKKGNWRSPTYE